VKLIRLKFVCTLSTNQMIMFVVREFMFDPSSSSN
jgi:hypothetical protein